METIRRAGLLAMLGMGMFIGVKVAETWTREMTWLLLGGGVVVALMSVFMMALAFALHLSHANGTDRARDVVISASRASRAPSYIETFAQPDPLPSPTRLADTSDMIRRMQTVASPFMMRSKGEDDR